MKTDSPHILCINPWIHDFAAFDFWAKPLGLLTIAAILRTKGFKVSYIDCLDRFHPRLKKPAKVAWDGRGPYRKTPIDLPEGLETIPRVYSRYGIDPAWFRADLTKMETPDLILVTSMMTYWAAGVAETIALIKEIFPDVPLVLGGVYASLCHTHAVENTLADRVVKGPGELALKNIFKDYLDYHLDDRALSGDLDDLPYPAFDLQRKMAYVPILTSRGCPFSCEYCASSFLEPTVRRRSAGHVFEEIRFWHERFGVINFPFYDDALLVNAKKYAFPLFEKIIESGMDLNFHTPNAVHVRAVTRQAARLMFKSGFKTIRLGLETTDFSANRSHDVKVAADDFFRAVDHLKAAGFEKKQIGAYLLCGLPDQDLGEVEASMRLVANTGILPVLAYFTPIPHTPIWERSVSVSKYDLVKHPVFTNNTLFPCVGSQPELDRISRLKNLVI